LKLCKLTEPFLISSEPSDAKALARGRSSRTLAKQPSKAAGATSPSPELAKASSSKIPASGAENSAGPNGTKPEPLARSKSLKPGDGKDTGKANGNYGVPDFIPAAQPGTGRTGVLVESIKLSSGVTLKMGPNVRSGGIPQHDPGHVTRKEYMAMREAGEGPRSNQAPSSDRRNRRVTGLVLPVIDKPKSR
jgi:hypothetical protein